MKKKNFKRPVLHSKGLNPWGCKMRHRWAAVGGAYRWSAVYKNLSLKGTTGTCKLLTAKQQTDPLFPSSVSEAACPSSQSGISVFYLLSWINRSLFHKQTDFWTYLTGVGEPLRLWLLQMCCRASALGRQPDRARLFLSPKINLSLITGGAAGCRAGQVTEKMLTAARPANLLCWWGQTKVTAGFCCFTKQNLSKLPPHRKSGVWGENRQHMWGLPRLC